LPLRFTTLRPAGGISIHYVYYVKAGKGLSTVLMLADADSTLITGLLTAEELNLLLPVSMSGASLMLRRHCYCAQYESIHGNEGRAPLILNLSTSSKREVSFNPRSLYPCGTFVTGGWLGPTW
jgi:hypothetical protein